MNSSLILYLLVGIITFLFGFSPPVFAGDVVLNEFLVDPDASQWVELYNKGTAAIDIGGWFIDDSGGTQKFTIPTGTLINSGEFKVFGSGLFNFNRTTPDVAQLLNGSTVEDSYSYSSGPGTNKSFGRQTDGTGDWVVFDSPTKGSTNNTSTPAPTATPTPTVVPTNTPVPTTAPTATKTPTPVKTPTPTPKSSSTGGSGATATPKPTFPPTSSPTKILALSSQAAGGSGNINTTISPTATSSPTSTKGPTKKPTPTITTAILGVAQSNLSKILIGLGVIFLAACGIIAFRSLRRGKDETY